MLLLTRILKIIWWIFNFLLSVFVVSGEYRKWTVFLYLLLENFYDGDIKFSCVAMFLESLFLLFFALYMIALGVYLAKARGKKVDYFWVGYWGILWTYTLYFVMYLELYS